MQEMGKETGKKKKFTCLYVLSATHIMKKKSPVRQTLCTAVMRKKAQALALGGPTVMAATSDRDREPRLDASRRWLTRKQKGSNASVAVIRPPNTR